LSPQEYQQKMDQVNQMRQQQGQAPMPVTPADQISTPTPQAAAPAAVARTVPTGQAAQAAPAAPKTAAPAAPKTAAPTAGGTIQSIAKASGITDPNKINVGQKIKLPDGGEYTVAPGDTLGAIAAGKFKGTAPTKPATPKAAATPAPAAPATGTQVQTDDDGNHMITTPDGKTVLVGPDGKPVANGGKLPAPTANVAAPKQPPATAANPAAGTVAGATKAIPTAPVNPANPSGRSSQMKITPEEAINATTINGAYAMELSHQYGSITKGKIANLIITKPISSLAYIPYNFGNDCVDRVIINGKLNR
jgi:LysM repeat protein